MKEILERDLVAILSAYNDYRDGYATPKQALDLIQNIAANALGMYVCQQCKGIFNKNNILHECSSLEKTYLLKRKRTNMNIEYKSDFGKGLVTCLVKFAEHAGRLSSDIKDFKATSLGISPISMHFNASSDHLYEIEVPDKFKDHAIGAKVKELRDKGLEMGHGFIRKTYTVEEALQLYDLAIEIALLIDKELGLNPIKGTF